MKIAMITPGLLPVPAVKGGAVEVLIEYLLEGNEKYKQHTIELYTVPSDEISAEKYQHTNIIQVQVKKTTQIINKLGNYFYKIFGIKKWRTSFGRELVKLLRNKEYDLIIFHNNLMAYRDVYEKTRHKEKLVYVVHNNVNDGDENHIIIANLIVRTARKVLAVSRYTMQNFQEVCESVSIDVLYNCIDLERYSHRILADEREELRQKYGINEKDFVFIYSGRIDVYKGVLELVQAFKQFQRREAKLLIVGASWFDDIKGDNPYLKQLQSEAECIKEHIIFTGFIKPSEMHRMYQISDCLVIPSVWEEPFGVVALEGMASKLPLIITNSGGLTEIVDEQCAIIVDKNHNLVYNLEQSMNAILCDKEKAKKMGESGYEKVMKEDQFNKKNYYKILCDKLRI